ncbi:MAG TPA: Smr/MutS family protein [Sphingomonas sp.]|nr:Smr/MutS family protein [Sphingomonas sp.]
MADRPLDPDAEALWRKVTQTVRPLGGRRTTIRAAMLASAPAVPPPDPRPAPIPKPGARPSGPGETLDGGWDRRLRRGSVVPDRTLDLHGHTLAAAHAALEAGLAGALASGARLLLVVTGRPPRERGDRIGGRPARGMIRASIGDWLACSPHADRIAAVRTAHPKHGGAGALYVVLRRPR